MSFEVVIKEHRPSGIMVENQHKLFWLPHTEISYEPDFNPDDLETIRRQYYKGRTVKVMVVGKAASDKKFSVVSIAATIHDPWKNDVPRWIESKTAKIMVVTDVSAHKCIRGRIQPGVEALISRDDLHFAFGQRSQDPFFIPQVGDHLAGLAIDKDLERRILFLSPAMLFRNCKPTSQPLSIDFESPATTLAPPRVFAILSDSYESKLNKANEVIEPSLVADGIVSKPTLPFKRILILDDLEDVAQCLSENLLTMGFEQIDTCSRMAQARKILCITKDLKTNMVLIDEDMVDINAEEVGAAIIDVNLENDEENGEFGGIRFAREIQKAYPSCRIILISGESSDNHSILRKIDAVGDLLISGYLFKPLTESELLAALNTARTESPRKASDLLNEFLNPHSPKGRRKNSADNLQGAAIQERLENNISKVLEDLNNKLKWGSRHGPDSLFLFSMHPLTYETKIQAQWGRPMTGMNYFGHKLPWSPVGDVCLDSRPGFDGWYDSNAEDYFARHRYLLYTYSRPNNKCSLCQDKNNGFIPCIKHRYKSCSAIQITGGPGDPQSYALFAISMIPNAFNEHRVLLQMQLAAAKISEALREFHQLRATEEDFPFLMTGRSACSLGHELCNFLQHGIDINTAISIAVNIRDQKAEDKDIQDMLDVLVRAKRQLDFALSTSKSFRDLSRDDAEYIVDIPFLDILDAKDGARRAAHPEIQRYEIAVYETDITGCKGHIPLISVRRNATVRVFQNLFNNSAQQMGLSGILSRAIRIDVSVKTLEREEFKQVEMLCVDIMDTGPGIHWVDIKRIFAPKFTTRKCGSGMGLYIVQQELNKIGGSVEVVESILGLGTKIRIWLPLAQNRVQKNNDGSIDDQG